MLTVIAIKNRPINRSPAAVKADFVAMGFSKWVSLTSPLTKHYLLRYPKGPYIQIKKAIETLNKSEVRVKS
ncbi:MAG: hypothetical protein KJ811_05550, partial [Candidatus Margulisbacteria bacterium]|nr:hypothetical protein [Candidatus Margulisiibacteriota bacterium]